MKKAISLLLLISIVFALTACSTDGGGTSSAGGSSSVSSGSSAADPSGGSVGFGDDTSIEATLTIWTWDQAAMEESAARFQQKYPNVSFEFLAVSSTAIRN